MDNAEKTMMLIEIVIQSIIAITGILGVIVEIIKIKMSIRKK